MEEEEEWRKKKEKRRGERIGGWKDVLSGVNSVYI